jgi:DNA-binding MarR family transcriptional regulator
MNDFPITPHRAKILQVLLDQGEIQDPDGQSTTLLMAETGHRTSNALSGVLLAMEKAGLIERDKAGRRTYRIALTRQGRKLAESLSGVSGGSPAPEPEAPTKLTADPDVAATVVNGAVDLDLLAGVLLKKALIATQAQEDSAGAKETQRRAERAEAKVAALEAELSAARSELAEQRAIVKTLEHNNQVLTNQMDKVRKNPATPIKELISRKELSELDKLMRSLPGGTRG